MLTENQVKATIIVGGAMEAARRLGISNDDLAAAFLKALLELMMVSPDRNAAADELIKIAEIIKAQPAPPTERH